MKVSRRQVLRMGAAGSALALGGCDGFYRLVARQMGNDIPESFALAADESIDPDFHLLSRLTFGPRPGDLDALREKGTEAWIDEQMHPDRIDDSACEVLARRYESVHMQAGNVMEFRKKVAIEELTRSTVLRAVFSRRQLHEVMVEFWTDHLNIDQAKAECVWYKSADDREVVRRHALGRFRDLIRASALSPAMLVYLDGQDNKVTKKQTVPNENYARELMELHTLGVHGGYSQKDVMEVARCLTGWVVLRGRVEFDRNRHDNGGKTVLGQTIPAGGWEKDLDRVLDIVTRHPSTAKFIAEKLCRRFVSDIPPEGLVSRMADLFSRTDGDIPEVLKALFRSEEFRAARGTRIKRPFRYIVSSLRALGAETTAPKSLLRYFTRMGQGPFAFPTPDGYPDEGHAWLGTFLWRWNFAVELASSRISGVVVRVPELIKRAGVGTPVDLFGHFVGRRPTDGEKAALATFAVDKTRRAEALGLIIASPAFQRF